MTKLHEASPNPMSILIFAIIIIILILVHEFGHFIVAKWSGIRVDEFGLGFPPRIVGKKFGDTLYSINWIPFGGFVKIFGEDADETGMIPEDQKKTHFSYKPKWIQALVLLAGVSFNVLFAWLLISIGFMTGLPSSVGVESSGQVQNAHIVVTEVRQNSPAAKAGLAVGDVINSLQSGNRGGVVTPVAVSDVQEFISAHPNRNIDIQYSRGADAHKASLVPVSGIIDGKSAIGISMDMIGTLKLSFFRALYEGAKLTGYLIKNIAVGLVTFLYHAITFSANFSQVTGPVGIIGLVGSASHLGFIYLLSLTAFISLNLAVINVIPFPALDGGRLLFVIIESIKRSPIKPKVANIINSVGFAILILLMVVVTLHDIIKF